jgi:hypothetical protein
MFRWACIGDCSLLSSVIWWDCAVLWSVIKILDFNVQISTGSMGSLGSTSSTLTMVLHPSPPHLHARSLAVHGNQWKGRCTRLSCMYSRAGESTAMHGMFYVHSYQVQNRLTWLVVMSRKQFLYSHHRITNSIELSLQDVIRLQCSDKVWSMSPSSFTCW